MQKSGSLRTHIVVPRELAERIDALVGERGRSRFLVTAAERELRRRAQMDALEAAAGSWGESDHPDLRGGSAAWVRRVRRQSDQRLRPAKATRSRP